MNREQILGLVRSVGLMVLAYFVGNGTLTSEQATQITNAAAEYGPAIAAFAITAYGWYRRRDAGLAKSAGKVDGVVVVANPDVASKEVVEAAIKAPNNEMQVGKLG